MFRKINYSVAGFFSSFMLYTAEPAESARVTEAQFKQLARSAFSARNPFEHLKREKLDCAEAMRPMKKNCEP